MKKIVSVLLVLIVLSAFLPYASFAVDETTESLNSVIKDENTPQIVMALNEEIIISNKTQKKITPPIMVLERVYVDLYDLAPFLSVTVKWIEAEVGYFEVTAGGKTIDFTLISDWQDLKNKEYKFFVKDSEILVSLRELADLCEYDLAYSNGLITIGNHEQLRKEDYSIVYNNIYAYNSDDYVYKKYPCWAEYVVNPLQEYSYETMLSDTKKLENMYPELIKTSSVGKSVEGRDLLLIKFGRGKNRIFVCGAHHAREYITTTYLMYAIDRYAYAYRNKSMWGKYSVKDILDNVTFCIVPMVNPDGVNLVQNGIGATDRADKIKQMGLYDGTKYGYSSWKANIHGVDINWNYDKDWSITKNKNNRGSSGFNGEYPASEPETVAISDYVDAISFEAYLSFHTQGQIFYWADNPENPTRIASAIRKDTGFTGFEEKATGIGGSFFDYVYRKFKKPTVTIELCPYIGNIPYPDEDFYTAWNPAKNVMLIVANEILH